LADEAVASVMKVPIGSPISLSESFTRLADGRAIEYGYARSPGDRIRLVTNTSRAPTDRRTEQLSKQMLVPFREDPPLGGDLLLVRELIAGRNRKDIEGEVP
jgi:hypothetical protein